VVQKSDYFTGEGAAFATQYAAVEGLEGFYQHRKVEQILCLLRELVPGEQTRVLDIAFGDGMFMRAVPAIDRTARSIGLDLALDNCRRAPAGAPVACGDAEMLPFANLTFDLVLLLDVIEHVPHGAPMLEQVHRVLRPGGALLLTTPNRWGLYEYKELVHFGSPWYFKQRGAWIDLLSLRYLRYRPSKVWPYHTRLYTAGQMIAEARAGGFELISATSINFCLPALGLLDRVASVSQWPAIQRGLRRLEVSPGRINHLLIQVYRKGHRKPASGVA
jgi:SAM-dependent methyltransferase